MKNVLSWAIFLVMAWLVSACSPSPAPVQEKTPSPPPTDTPTAVVESQTVSFDEVMDITWQWTQLDAAQPAGQTTVPAPENYTLTFLPEGELQLKADCNQVTGTYTVDGSSLTLSTLGPSTLAACPEGSLDQEYLAALNTVSSFGMQADQLVLVLKENAGKMTFSNGGLAAAPAPDVCAGINFASVTLEAQALPYTWQKNCVAATPYDSSLPPTPVGLPEHIEIKFIPNGAQNAQPEDPIIYLIPVDAYRELWDENGNQAVSTSLVQLRTLLKEQPAPIPSSSLPVLPYEEVGGVNDLAVQGEYLEDENFTGLRFIGRFSQGPNPVTNQGLMYIYQGGTYDAEYFIAFFYPVSTSELPNSATDVPAEEMQQVDNDPAAYLAEKEAQLNALQPEDWEPDLTVLDAVIGSLQFEKVSQAEAASSTTVPLITGQLWKWIEVAETQPAGQTIVPDPDKYTLILNPDGRFDLLADCNSGSGSYVMEGDSLDLTVETMTMAFCSPESLSDSFVTLIGEVKTYVLDGDQLKLITAEGGEELLFSSGGPVVGITAPAEGVPTAVALEPLNIRSGPGSEYSSYGTAPVGASGEVIGVSDDGGWWVVKIPAEIAPDQQGWVNANYVQVTGAENVPVIPTP